MFRLLAPDGSRKQKLAAQYAKGTLTFSIGPDAKSLWFEIVAN